MKKDSFGSRGPIVITETQTINLSEYGLAIGDPINVICVGGGAGGGSGYYDGTASGIYDGYGSGGRGGAYKTSSYVGGAGGGSGYVAKKTIILDTLEVPVTIGAGGSATNMPGGITSFGSYLSAQGGNRTEGGNQGEEAKQGTIGEGGLGFINNGIFSVGDPSGCGFQTGNGAVFIWY